MNRFSGIHLRIIYKLLNWSFFYGVLLYLELPPRLRAMGSINGPKQIIVVT